MASSATVTLSKTKSYWLNKGWLQNKQLKMSSKIGEKPSKTPALVATAFPPLNPAKLGKVSQNG